MVCDVLRAFFSIFAFSSSPSSPIGVSGHFQYKSSKGYLYCQQVSRLNCLIGRNGVDLLIVSVIGWDRVQGVLCEDVGIHNAKCDIIVCTY